MSKILVTEETLSGISQIAAHLKSISDKPIIENGEETKVSVAEMAIQDQFRSVIESLQVICDFKKYNMVIKELSFEKGCLLVGTISSMESFFIATGYPIVYED